MKTLHIFGWPYLKCVLRMLAMPLFSRYCRIQIGLSDRHHTHTQLLTHTDTHTHTQLGTHNVQCTGPFPLVNTLLVSVKSKNCRFFHILNMCYHHLIKHSLHNNYCISTFFFIIFLNNGAVYQHTPHSSVFSSTMEQFINTLHILQYFPQ